MQSSSNLSERSYLLRNKVTPMTSSRRKSMHSGKVDENLTSARDANIEDVGPHVHEIPVEDFLARFLPPIRPAYDLGAICAHLQRTGKLTETRGWAAFPIKPKARKRVHEDVCYEDVKLIIDAIVAAAREADDQREAWPVSFKPTDPPKASIVQDTARPDCAISLRVRGNDLWWDDIAVTGEFKKDDSSTSDTNSNTKQIIWDMNQTMRNDPSRRFTFGYTIENTDMRIWRCDRADLVVSEIIDFIDDYMQVIRFFLAILFADVEQLGWDPTMQRIGDTDKFIITVNTGEGEELRFRTINLLSRSSADALRGRSTRVWKSEQVDENDQVLDPGPFALKDTWIDADRAREGEIIAALRDLGEPGSKDRSVIENALLSVHCHGDVSINGQQDLTLRDDAEKYNTDHTLFEVEREKRSAERQHERTFEKRVRKSTPVGSTRTPKEEVPQYHRKAHYRIVYGEVGTPLHSVDSLQNVYVGLGNVVRGLEVMHSNGWVHRDIKYAKKFDQDDIHEIRTANVLFTPVEIALESYCFTVRDGKKRKRLIQSDVDSFDDWDRAQASGSASDIKRAEAEIQVTRRIRVILQYNPLHDLESVFWISVYFLICRKVVQVGGRDCLPRSRAKEEDQKKLAATMLADPAQKYIRLKGSAQLEDDFQSLHIALSEVSDSVLEVLDALCKAYGTAEEDLNAADWFKIAKDVYGCAREEYYSAASFLKALGDVKVVRYDAPKKVVDAAKNDSSAGGSNKRARIV
ncbi:hypothetical protein NM688_g3466 [Phlebia brevispora]|uniref:Uncharacterized protein n=1 Tax=Phlebia brevispora TaxID=194682 RepID=A0ACC1T5F8_9APHY|nr:hypothetical protein NM688_g3466 [Phlebia brevispora]